MPRPSRRAIAALSSTTLLVVTLLASSCGLFDSEEPPPATLPIPREVDIPYGPAGRCAEDDPDCSGSQLLDIYRSDEPGPNPVLLWFHGGGFVLGTHEGVREEFQAALDAGWDIVSVGYRLALDNGNNTFPTAIHDAKLAVRWVRANAGAQDWDPDAIAAIGHSAGGNIVGMLATTAGMPLLEPQVPEGSGLAGVDSSILAGVAIASVSDLAGYASADEQSRNVVERYLGCFDSCPDIVAAGSVHTHVDADSAPLLVLHGVDDPLANPAQGELVRDGYVANGIGDRFELIVVEDGPEQYRGHNPDFSRFTGDFVEFLDAQRP